NVNADKARRGMTGYKALRPRHRSKIMGKPRLDSRPSTLHSHQLEFIARQPLGNAGREEAVIDLAHVFHGKVALVSS
ncbi:hypothetical protein E4U47_000584, partial [Claviceps purpurea]